MSKYKKNRCLQLIIIVMCHCALAFGQKLPKVQQAGVRAPENIKIDGKLTEWNNQFQAYNRGNYLYYTIANDDNNLYLTVHTDDIVCSKKIFRAGLVFTIVSSSKKANRLSVTFPDIPARMTDAMERLVDGPLVYKILREDTAANKARFDSLITTSNMLIGKVYNQIRVTGIPGASDALISIYNTQGIRVGASVDKSMKYNYELAIPLKYLGDAINSGKKFKYDVKLYNESWQATKVQYTGPVVVFGPPVSRGSASDQFLYQDTGFSGEYTLVKKK